MSLGEAREQIDRLDEQLLRLIARRLALARKVAKEKRATGLPFKQPEREAQLIAERRSLAAKLGLEEGFAEKIFLAIIDESLAIQKSGKK